MATEAPKSYRDPYYAELSASMEKKHGLPPGLLRSIIVDGERSNADQVSSAGARTVAQIIPSTRKAMLDKHGIDAYLSPQNALEVAGLLLKESMDRNGGNVERAVREYHGGTNPKNWGPINNAYWGRVSAGMDKVVADASDAAARFSAKASEQATIRRAYEAYRAGRMAPEDAAEFEQDVNSGAIRLPLGYSLISKPEPSYSVPQSVIDAYQSGKMSPQDAAEFEADMRANPGLLPAGVSLQRPEPENKRGLIGSVVESVTGNDRRTAETEAAADWMSMPELNPSTLPSLDENMRLQPGANADAATRARVGTALASPREAAQIIQAQFPGVQARQDEKGNYFLRSGVDGREYAIKPGFRTSDIPRAGMAVAAFTPAGRATTIPRMAVASGATQAAIEGTQAATGGEFNSGDVAAATLAGAVVPAAARGIGMAKDAVKSGLARLRGAPQPVAAAEQAAMAGAAPAAAQPAVGAAGAGAVPGRPPAAAASMSMDDMAQAARKAADGGMGSRHARQVLAEQAAPNAKTLEAARRLGIEDYLQPDHVTTSQAYREFAQAVKSFPGSVGSTAEREGLQRVGERASRLIDDLGGTSDLSAVSDKVRSTMQATQNQLTLQAERLYGQVSQAIPAKTAAPPTSTLSFLAQHADELGGAQRLLPVERKLLSTLNGKDGEVTYAFLDQTRKQIGQAMRKSSGPFADSESGMLKKLYSALSEDQFAIAQAQGVGDVYKAARSSVAVRKALEDDLAALFGKNLDHSAVGGLSRSVRALGQGDSESLVRFLKAVPPEMRQEVVTSGLEAAFRKQATNGPISFSQYAQWYEGLLRNRKAHTAIMISLPPEARKQLSDLYRVSKGISQATSQRIPTGRLNSAFAPPETMAARIYDAAKSNAMATGAATVGTAIGGPGVGAVLGSALTKGAKSNARRAADELIASPEFVQLVKETAAGAPAASAIRRFVSSAKFARYFKAIGQPMEMSNRERWVMQVIQGRINSQGE